jgi:antirestriction protein ArdC
MRPGNATDRPPPRDFREEVTNDVIKLLEQGTAPWQQPWTESQSGRIPFNPTTLKPYRGGNIIALMVSSFRHGYNDPRWMTYRQFTQMRWGLVPFWILLANSFTSPTVRLEQAAKCGSPPAGLRSRNLPVAAD